MSFNKFYFSNFGRQLFQRLFSLEHRGLEHVFMGVPSQDLARQTDCLTCALKKLVLEVPMTAFLKKRMLKNRMVTLITTEKRLYVLKATQIFVSFFSCFDG